MESPPLPASVPPRIPASGAAGAPPVIGGPPRGPGKMGAFTKMFLAGIVGLVVLGVGFVGFRIYQMRQWNKAHPNRAQGMKFFMRAADEIGVKGAKASGNSEEARKLAGEMSELMLKLRMEGFSQGQQKSWMDAGQQFNTYCELRSNECVFLVFVPEMRRFNGDAQDALGKEAWEAALALLTRDKTGHAGMKLAVGLRGIIFFDRVMTGRWVEDASGGDNGLDQTVKGDDGQRLLYDWFEPEGMNSR